MMEYSAYNDTKAGLMARHMSAKGRLLIVAVGVDIGSQGLDVEVYFDPLKRDYTVALLKQALHFVKTYQEPEPEERWEP